jgi:hypothetical protein
LWFSLQESRRIIEAERKEKRNGAFFLFAGNWDRKMRRRKEGEGGRRWKRRREEGGGRREEEKEDQGG